MKNDTLPLKQLNDWIELAKKHKIYPAFQDIGRLTPSGFEALMTWVNPYEGIGCCPPYPSMIYICGTDAYKGFNSFLIETPLRVAEDVFLSNYIEIIKVANNIDKSIFICLDPYLDQIGCSDYCFMIAEQMLTFKDFDMSKKYITAEELHDYCHFKRKNKSESLVSLLEVSDFTYPELCLVATGIKPHTEEIELIDYKTVIEFGHGKIGIHLGFQDGVPVLALTDKGTGKLGEYGSTEGYPRIATKEETYAILRFANKQGVTVLIEELQKLKEQFDELSNESKKITRPPILNKLGA